MCVDQSLMPLRAQAMQQLEKFPPKMLFISNIVSLTQEVADLVVKWDLLMISCLA